MGVDREPGTAKQFTTFGWQGIRLTVPSTWSLVFTQGNHEAGNIRLADENSVRLEMRWQPSARSQAPQAIVDAYLRRLAKRARKDRLQLSVDRNLNLTSPLGKDVECYRWTAEQQVLAMLSRCRQCGRIVHLHLIGRPEEPLKGLARTVFASLDDHPEGSLMLWKFLDVEFASPVSLPLTDRSLQAGCIRMAFGRRLLRLEFARVSLAEVLLARKGLAQWFTEFYKKQLRRRRFEIQEVPVKGHQGIDVTGRAWLLVNPSRLLGRPRILRAACWHCDGTNRIFICSFDGSAGAAPMFPQALAGFTCCARA
jgi:hypothetical protein